MKTYVWQVTLLASIQVTGPNTTAAEQKLREAVKDLSISASTVDGAFVITSVDIEGAVDLIDAIEEDRTAPSVSRM